MFWFLFWTMLYCFVGSCLLVISFLSYMNTGGLTKQKARLIAASCMIWPLTLPLFVAIILVCFLSGYTPEDVTAFLDKVKSDSEMKK